MTYMAGLLQSAELLIIILPTSCVRKYGGHTRDTKAIVRLKAKCEKLILIAFFGLTATITSMEVRERPLMDMSIPRKPIS